MLKRSWQVATISSLSRKCNSVKDIGFYEVGCRCPYWSRRPLGGIFARFLVASFIAGRDPLELPNEHRVPLTWLVEHGCESVRLRTYRDLAPSGFASPESIQEASDAVAASKLVTAITKKQKPTGVWGKTLLGPAAPGGRGEKDMGALAEYRRLIELGLDSSARQIKLADRVFFRLLSRDPDPQLLFEFRTIAKTDPTIEGWARERIREAATAALAEGGHSDDPRIRGSAHKIASSISQFLRSPLADKPLVKAGQKTLLHPDARPPTWYSVGMLAAMPSLRRERAGFTERLGAYLAKPGLKKDFAMRVGRRILKPKALLMGDPIRADRQGSPKDIPLALHYIELLSRIGALHTAPTASKVLARLVKDCDENGVWHPKNLRSRPKSSSLMAYHAFPLCPEASTLESRQVDVTFRLALIAKHLGWDLTYR